MNKPPVVYLVSEESIHETHIDITRKVLVERRIRLERDARVTVKGKDDETGMVRIEIERDHALKSGL